MKQLVTLIKSFVLVVLISTSLIQISELWFEDSSDRNFFYNVLPNSELLRATALKDVGNILQPHQISVYFAESNVEYTVIRSGANIYDNINDATVEIIKATLKKENFIESVDFPESLWKQQHIMLKLPVVFERTLLEENLNLNRKALKEFESVKTMIIVPASESDLTLNVYVEDYETKSYQHYETDVSSVQEDNDLLNYFLKEYVINRTVANYVSTLKNAGDYYKENILLPLPSKGIRYHEELILDIPFVNGDGEFDVQGVSSYVEHFFENPDIINVNEFDGGLLYKFPTAATVMYSDQGLVHYTNNVSNKKAEYVDVSIALSVANQFIEKDMNALSAEYYLREMETNQQSVTFYYDIGYNDFPMVMDKELMNLYELSKPYPIVVKIFEDEVVEYKRILRSVDEMIPQNRIFEAEYKDALDQYVGDTGNKDKSIEDTYLGYRWMNYGETLKLNWVIETIDGDEYFYEIP